MPAIAKPTIIGVLGLGQMGAGIAADLKASGFDVISTLEGRSERTHQRAEMAGVRVLPNLGDVIASCDTFLSVVAADQAEPLAAAVAAVIGDHQLHFVDCNSITPSKTLRIAEYVEAAGATFSDAGIIGPPPGNDLKTRFYVSGPASEVLIALQSERMPVIRLGDGYSQATEMKVLFAAANKGATALMCNIMAAARKSGLLAQVTADLDAMRPGLLDCIRRSGPGLLSKAARWAIEMEDVSQGLIEMGVDGGYHAAAAESYHRLAQALAEKENDGDALDRILSAWIQQ